MLKHFIKNIKGNQNNDYLQILYYNLLFYNILCRKTQFDHQNVRSLLWLSPKKVPIILMCVVWGSCAFLSRCLSLLRAVLVSNYTQTLDLLQDVCDQIGYKWCRLDGQTPVAQRQRIVDSFNSPHSPNFLMLLSSKAGGVGLNLIGASHLVLYDMDWNPANDIQVSGLPHYT